MTTNKIYIRVVDGTDTFVPVNVRQHNYNQFEILDDPEYADLDTGVLFEFYPGDIVGVDDSEDIHNDYQYVAKLLILPSGRPDRDYLEFMFLGTLRLLPIHRLNAYRFKHVIEKIKKEKLEGKFFYRGILETINAFDKL